MWVGGVEYREEAGALRGEGRRRGERVRHRANGTLHGVVLFFVVVVSRRFFLFLIRTTGKEGMRGTGEEREKKRVERELRGMQINK